jgi:toxin ParE1/3/4
VKRELVFRPEASADLKGLYDYIEQNSPANAARYVERIEAYCMGLLDYPERGTRRDDLRPGIRIVGFQRRIGIAFAVFDDRVEIARILYCGRDLGSLQDEDFLP